MQVGFNFGPRGAQHRAHNSALSEPDRRMNPGEAFCPRAAQELGQHGLRLVVAGVGRGHRIHLARGHQLPEPAVTQPPRGLFQGLTLRRSLGGRIHAPFVKGQTQPRRQSAGKLQIPVSLGAPQPVVQVSHMERQPQFHALPGQST